jgi:hypothetical protein
MIANLRNKFIQMLQDAGLDDSLIVKAIKSGNREIATKVVRLISAHGFEPTVSQEQARKIMGKNIFGIEEAIRHYGVNPTRRQLHALSEIPFTPALLHFKKHTHVLVAKFPVSIIVVRSHVDTKLFHHQTWYNHQLFAEEQEAVSWELVKKTPKSNSFSLGWCEQKDLIGENDKVPSANVLVYTIIGYWIATGRKLFRKTYVRTSTTCLSGKRVYVGHTDGGIRINYCWENCPKSYVGITSSRKVFF